MNGLKNKTQEELEKLQNVAVEIAKLCAEDSQRAQKESHEDLEPLWKSHPEAKKTTTRREPVIRFLIY